MERRRSIGLPAFATEEQFGDTIGNDSKRLLEIWNSLAGVTPVKKFANRKIATERIGKAIQGLRAPAPTEQAPVDSCETPDPVAEEHQAAIESAADHVDSSEVTAELAPGSAPAADVAPAKAKATRKTTAVRNAPKGKKSTKSADGAEEGHQDRRGGGDAPAEERRDAGRTMEKFGWQRHTLRGFMAGAMKKAGFQVESFKPDGGERTYRVAK